MNKSKFDSIISKRTSEIAYKRFSTFREDVRQALAKLYEGTKYQWLFQSNSFYGYNDTNIEPFGLAVKSLKQGHTPRLPQQFFDDVSEDVSKKLLAIMDEMQRALVAPDAPADSPVPATKEEQETGIKNKGGFVMLDHDLPSDTALKEVNGY